MKKWLSLLLVVAFAGASIAGTYSAGNAKVLSPGSTLQVWNAEQPTPGNGGVSASLAVALIAVPSQNGTPFRVHGFFSGAPGAFEIDVQVAEIDTDTNYQTISNGNITSVDSTNNTFHLDAVQVSARFARLLMRSRANAVNVTGWIGR